MNQLYANYKPYTSKMFDENTKIEEFLHINCDIYVKAITTEYSLNLKFIYLIID
ncbi:hypothetical protein J45TS6_35090 [Paenibacillus sp. J45TS6]|nr:hypothetical protein J45TS6_35090 [Paenibacillus sp. J45TS6]